MQSDAFHTSNSVLKCPFGAYLSIQKNGFNDIVSLYPWSTLKIDSSYNDKIEFLLKCVVCVCFSMRVELLVMQEVSYTYLTYTSLLEYHHFHIHN